MSQRSVGPGRPLLGMAATTAVFCLLAVTAIGCDRSVDREANREMVLSSIAKDCSVDVTTELLSWIGSVPDGATMSFPKGGCYRVDGQLQIEGRADLRFEGNGATFRAMTPGGKARHHWLFIGGRNITLRDIVIRGGNPRGGTDNGCYNPEREFQHGVALQGVQGAVLENLQIYDTHGDSIYVGKNEKQPTRDVVIRGGRFERTGRQGIGIVAADGLLIENNYVNGVCMSVFDLEPHPDTYLRDITITNNTVGEYRHLFIPKTGASVEASNIVVSNNRVLGTAGMRWPHGPGSAHPTVSVQTGRSSNWTVRNNDFARFEGIAFGFVGATGVTVVCNRVRWISDTGTGVHLESVRNATVSDNRFVGASVVVATTDTSNVEMSANALTDTPFPDSCGTIGPKAGEVPTPTG